MFLFFVAEFLCLYAFSQSCSVPSWQPPFHFPKVMWKLKFVISPGQKIWAGLLHVLSSHLPKLALPVAIRSKHKEPATGQRGMCGWGMLRAGGAQGQLGESMSQMFPVTMLSQGGLFDELCDVVCLLPFNVFQDSFLLLSLLLSAPCSQPCSS